MTDRMLSQAEINQLLTEGTVPEVELVPPDVELQLVQLSSEKWSAYENALTLLLSQQLLQKQHAESIETFEKWAVSLQTDLIRIMMLTATGYEVTLNEMKHLFESENEFQNKYWTERIHDLISFISYLSDHAWDKIFECGSSQSTAGQWLFGHLQQERQTLESISRIDSRAMQLVLREYLKRYDMSNLAVLTSQCSKELRKLIVDNLSSRLRIALSREETLLNDSSEKSFLEVRMQLIRLFFQLKLSGEIVLLRL